MKKPAVVAAGPYLNNNRDIFIMEIISMAYPQVNQVTDLNQYFKTHRLEMEVLAKDYKISSLEMEVSALRAILKLLRSRVDINSNSK